MAPLQKIINENKTMVYSGGVALLGILLVLLFIRQEVDRFIFIMPIFAGWILFNILMLPDEDLEDSTAKSKKPAKKG
jgi:hypothetical protein